MDDKRKNRSQCLYANRRVSIASSQRNSDRRNRAVVAEYRGELTECLWVRMLCPRCGEYDATLPAELTEAQVEAMNCHHCASPLSWPQYYAKGKTTRRIPSYSKPRKINADWLKRGDRTKGGRPLKRKAAAAGVDEA